MWRIHLRVPRLEVERPLGRPGKVCMHTHTHTHTRLVKMLWSDWKSALAGNIQLMVNTELINT